MWLPDSARTRCRGFKHRLITRGPPLKMPLHRLSRYDTEWIEKALKEDVDRGQLVKGSSEWGFPAFPTKPSASHKAVQRDRRIVVDYRALNRVTVRRTFMIPNSDEIKGTVAGSSELTVGDLKEGFNQAEIEESSKEKMAVLAASGSYLPQGLTFGPTNGPEDFQELVFIIFGKRLYKDWFLFLDDLTVATGRPSARGDTPSGAHDVCTCVFQRPRSSGELASDGLTRAAGPGAFPSPIAHWPRHRLCLWLVVLCASIRLCFGLLYFDQDIEKLNKENIYTIYAQSASGWCMFEFRSYSRAPQSQWLWQQEFNQSRCLLLTDRGGTELRLLRGSEIPDAQKLEQITLP